MESFNYKGGFWNYPLFELYLLYYKKNDTPVLTWLTDTRIILCFCCLFIFLFVYVYVYYEFSNTGHCYTCALDIAWKNAQFKCRFIIILCTEDGTWLCGNKIFLARIMLCSG